MKIRLSPSCEWILSSSLLKSSRLAELGTSSYFSSQTSLTGREFCPVEVYSITWPGTKYAHYQMPTFLSLYEGEGNTQLRRVLKNRRWNTTQFFAYSLPFQCEIEPHRNSCQGCRFSVSDTLTQNLYVYQISQMILEHIKVHKELT